MPNVRGCDLPDDLLYDVENHMWFREVDGGKVQLGMTMVATALAGQLVAFTGKRVGKKIKAGKSVGTVESGKWVGPAKSAAAGLVAELNQNLVNNPSIANDDPYNEGWMVVLEPEDWQNVKSSLVLGSDVTGPYEAKMDADNFAGCGA
ncbi:MAG: glycine cleavage system protein H [Kordiimonadaceae bacterium]|jgi:glycine cleavage system H protein|nr:glycine cleavage system protein H [Kordiimonadaceae bacterium]MBT6032635.1 glycine cleavage system protein H [Kordiimonadaceae bacterium]MBT6330372.1 glycine cleavage system protein H [Kordiimonadaceae bacterium]MBT7581903.1 glycine cleavage system protein H [Kordiimonadaceae bacterium]